MDYNMEELHNYFNDFFEWLFLCVIGLISFIYLSDRKKLSILEDKMVQLETHSISRIEIKHEIDKVTADYREDHRGIGERVDICRRELREDNARLEKKVEALTDAVMQFAERRSKGRP